MVKGCIVPGCRNTEKDTRDKNIHFHRLPISKPHLLMEWMAMIKSRKPTISKYSRICSIHFSPDCFERDMRSELLGTKPIHRLKEHAVPTIFNCERETTISNAPSTSRRTVNAESKIIKRKNLNKKIYHVSQKYVYRNSKCLLSALYVLEFSCAEKDQTGVHFLDYHEILHNNVFNNLSIKT